MQYTDWNLIALALFAVAVLVVLVTRLKVNAFIALIAAALIVGLGAVAMGLNEIKLDRDISPPSWKTLGSLTALRLINGFQEGLGATLGTTAAIIALGTMLGKLLAESGGAEVLAKRFAAFFGPEHVGLCIMALALVVGLVTWFAVGLVLLLPILLTLTRETKRPFLNKLAANFLEFMNTDITTLPWWRPQMRNATSQALSSHLLRNLSE